ncbi:MAG: ribosomal RNA small subunit methyltransferase A [Euryarchaeota archaeon RBG_13_57_23]|nr:MAG: ribosomal RNA small subunit methyltransferase A [Euryarchaeota archaeon RBG_13_57_23]
MRAEELKGVLESLGKRPTKRLGQNFLLDERVIERQIGYAGLTPADTVLEIGPGLGNLTEALLKTGARVVAVEQDPVFCQFLKKRFGDRVALTQADAVKAFLPQFNKVVSNLPYQISSPITFKLLELGFEVAVVMLQREFAERMIAKPGTPEYGRLSVGVYYRADCEIKLNVPRTAFWPQPKVDSCVVRLVPRKPPFVVKDERAFHAVTKAIFSHRRKMISNSLRTDPAVRSYIDENASKRLDELPFASRRAEELTPGMIGELADALLGLSLSSASSGNKP